MRRIVIFIHRHDSFGKTNYWLRAIAEIWREDGIDVSVIRGLQPHVDADLAVLHVDLTTIPDDYLDYVRRYSTIINGGVPDISKRLISSHLLHRGDRHDGPVIVKTDRNDRGRRERRLVRKGLLPNHGRDVVGNYVAFSREAYRAGRRWWRHGSRDAFRNYPIFGSIAEVPADVWNDPELVVERFLPERRNDHYCVRTWLFLGDRERHAMFFSPQPVIKSTDVVGFERLPDVPEELRKLRRDLKFDFGKFDYAMVDGEVVLYDANRTPSVGSFPRDRYLPLARSLAEGIGAFL
jgi:hypothetical protein